MGCGSSTNQLYEYNVRMQLRSENEALRDENTQLKGNINFKSDEAIKESLRATVQDLRFVKHLCVCV